MICSKGHKLSFCVGDKEYCKVCGEPSNEEPTTYIDLPFTRTAFLRHEPRFSGYSFKEIQGYRTYGMIQKY